MSNSVKNFSTVNDAYQFLQELGVPSKLLLHVKLVGKVAELLISKLHELQIEFDEDFFRLGVVFHDAGKIIHPRELVAKGKNHEADGEQLLIANGVDAKLARCCRSHGQWQKMECSFEELCVALANTLWKGKRNSVLEELFIEMLASRCDLDRWTIYLEMDSYFEEIASERHSRLQRSFSDLHD